MYSHAADKGRDDMTKLVFALVVMAGAKTIAVEHFAGIEICLYYADKLNSQHIHGYRHIHRDDTIHARCQPARVDPQTTEIFTH